MAEGASNLMALVFGTFLLLRLTHLSSGSCEQDSLGLENNVLIPDSWLTSSSTLNANTPAKNGRLNYAAGSSWCASSRDNYAYLEIDLQTLHIICAVSTQGNHQADRWVKTFSLQSSRDGKTWTNYTDDQVSMKLGRVEDVAEVHILSKNSYTSNKYGPEIRVGDSTANGGANNHLCANNIRLAANQEGTFFCKPTASGRYVYIRHPGAVKIVTVCEVEVYSSYLPNLALNQPATQASVFGRSWAFLAVDGNKNTDYSQGSCIHTQMQTDPWWRVDLGASLPVAEVVIVNRLCTSPCENQLTAFEIRIGNDTISYTFCGRNLSLASAETKPFYCDPPTVGRYVSVVILGTKKYLGMCEVEVYSVRQVSSGVTGDYGFI
ncbi:PREDICTED: uncharacterized protein LOC107333133 [Acropora digitifera]|uniref:uncharacterized protein LOC107333133 n=1 Tax=Acropora digitifera TaxID=70779 RepID=UPI000779FADD|nr:PREDICTED: uncharacterized protein LOC107333133 [Acropora digitifera]